MHVGVLSVVEVRIRFPDLVQEVVGDRDRVVCTGRGELKTFIFPHLTKVAVHLVGLAREECNCVRVARCN